MQPRRDRIKAWFSWLLAVAVCQGISLASAPVITIQPQSQSILAGSNATFSVAASGTAPLSYQWSFNGTNLSNGPRISGAPGTDLTVSNLVAGDAGSYQAVVTNSKGSATSSVATLTVLLPPGIAVEPASQTVVANNGASFTVSAVGTAPLSYQWYLGNTALANGGQISGATSSTLTFSSVSPSNAGDYHLTISNAYGNTASSNATLTVVPMVVSVGPIVAWGKNDWGVLNVPPTLTNVIAIAASWDNCLALRADGTVVAWGNNGYGQINVPAGLSNVVAVSAGYGFSVALRADGSVVAWGDNLSAETAVPQGLSDVMAIWSQAYHSLALSTNGTLTQWGNYIGYPIQPPTPADLTNVVQAAPGFAMTLVLHADGTTSAWGATGTPTFPGVSNAVAVAAGDHHSVVVRLDGSVVAAGVNDWGQTNVPADATNIIAATAGLNHTLALRSNGTLIGWGQNDWFQATPPAGLSNVVEMGGGYQFSVALVGSGHSRLPGTPSIATPLPPLVRVSPNDTFYLSIRVMGLWPLSYQWLFNGLPLPGQTNASLTLPNPSTNNNGSYCCLVTNAFGAATSTVAVLRLKDLATLTMSNLSQSYDGSAKPVSVQTTPAGLSVVLNYNGTTNAPTGAGSYTVVGSVSDPNYYGAATNTLVITKAAGAVTISNLMQSFDAFPKSVSVATLPPGLAVNVTYNGSTYPPANVGSYAVIAAIGDPNYQGSTSGTLVIGQNGPLTNTDVWIGPGDGLNNWSRPANWSLGRVPGPGDYAMFTDAGSSATVSNINNVMDAGFSGAIGTLWFANSNGFHTTLIAPGQTLDITGDLVSGIGPFFCGPLKTNTVTGPGGALVMDGPTNVLAIGDHFTYYCYPPGTPQCSLDMSGLGTFSANIGRILVPDWDGQINSGGTLALARTNMIRAAGPPPAILIADGAVDGSWGAGAGAVLLGQTNVILADTIRVGHGQGSGYLGFNPVFTNSSAFFRGQDGASRVDEVVIADGVNGFQSRPPIPAAMDFSSGTVDLQANRLIMSRIPTNDLIAGSSGTASSTLSFSQGTIDVNTLQIGVNAWVNGSYAAGTLNVQGTARLVVNSSMIMGISSNGYRFWDVSAETMGALNISGGTVAVPGIQCGLISTNNTITMTNGTLLVSGTIGPGLANFVMADSSLQLQASATPSAVVTNLSTGGASNLLNIGSVVGLNSFPTQVTLIKYSGSIGGAGFNFGLGALPSTGYSGYLSNNAANSSVDLVLSALLLAGRLTNGNFQLTINGQPNRVVDILTSTNLSDWTWFITVTNSSGTSVFIDPAAISAQRFYRAQQVP